MTTTIISNSDQSLNMLISIEGRELRLHSSRPYAEADKIFSQLNPEAPVYFVGGIGMGYLLEKILSKTKGICLVYEPLSPIIETALKAHSPLSTLLQNPRVITVRDLKTFTYILHKHKFTDIVYTINRTYGELFAEQFDEAKNIIISFIRKQEISNSTLLRFGKIWTKNLFRNMHRFFTAQKLSAYKQWAQGKSAVIVGAGPSLEEALPILRQYQNHTIIIACDTVAPVLSQHNINPDFILTVDPQEQNSFYLRYSSHKDYTLIADPCIHDSSFEGYTDDRIVLMDSVFPLYQPFEHFWGKSELLASGGSVSTSAFDFARYIGADPIIMVGQDLSFTKRKTYSTGNVLSEFSRTTHHRLNSFHQIQALTTHASHTHFIKGRSPNSQVHADARLILFRDWFDQEIPKTVATVIVLGMEGAYLEGAQHLPFDHASTLFTGTIDKRSPPQAQKKLSSQEYYDFLEEIQQHIQAILPTCTQILASVNKAQQHSNLSLALQGSTKLQDHLSLYPHLSFLISIAIQDAVQNGLNISPNISPQEHIVLIQQICQETLRGLKDLKHFIHKAKKMIHPTY